MGSFPWQNKFMFRSRKKKSLYININSRVILSTPVDLFSITCTCVSLVRVVTICAVSVILSANIIFAIRWTCCIAFVAIRTDFTTNTFTTISRTRCVITVCGTCQITKCSIKWLITSIKTFTVFMIAILIDASNGTGNTNGTM